MRLQNLPIQISLCIPYRLISIETNFPYSKRSLYLKIQPVFILTKGIHINQQLVWLIEFQRCNKRPFPGELLICISNLTHVENQLFTGKILYSQDNPGYIVKHIFSLKCDTMVSKYKFNYPPLLYSDF